jgi:methylated-DNA-[protein]-cysteine S-methyltransferase
LENTDMRNNDTISRLTVPSPLGDIIVAASGKGLLGIWFHNQRHLPDMQGWVEAPQHPLLRRARQQLDEYFAGQRHAFDLPLDPSRGTAFQQSVWQALRQIPAGHTTSYGAISQQLGKPAAVRAVGAAVGRNPWSIVVPCHRVLGSTGALTGYAGGLARKSSLLQLEGAL